MSQELTAAEEQFLSKIESHINENDDPHGSVKLMLYGDSGTGKTTAAMQLAHEITPKGKTTCYMDTSQGWWFIAPNLRENAFRVSTSDLGIIQNVAKACENKLGRFADVGTIVIDEHSSIAHTDLLNITKKNSDKSDKGKDQFAPEWKDMNSSSNRVLLVSIMLVVLQGVNVIFISHERSDKEESTGVVTFGPLHLPKYSSRLSGLLNLVGRVTADMSISDNEGITYSREIQIHPTRRVVAKCKIGGMENKVRVKPEELINVISNWLKVKEEPEIETVSLEDELEEVGN